MKIFLSHSHAQKQDANRLALALRAAGHTVFLDTDGLKPGSEYNAALRRALQASDLVVFLVTRESLDPDSFARTELEWAREAWPNPVGQVLAVQWQADLPLAQVPDYLTVTTVRHPEGNRVATTVGWVEEIAERKAAEAAAAAAAAAAAPPPAPPPPPAPRWPSLAASAAVLLVATAAAVVWLRPRPPPLACLLRLTVLAAPAPVSSADLVSLPTRRSFVVSNGVAAIDFAGLTAAPARWTMVLVLQDGREAARFEVKGCPTRAEDISDDAHGSRIRIEPRS